MVINSVDLPSPSQLLGVGNFNEWYPGQYDLLDRCLQWYDSPSRFLGLSVPTGAGKSLSSVLLSQMVGLRTVILTATKGLQNQYMRDFSGLGMVEVKGQNNFPCLLVPGLTADEGPCHDGMSCDVKNNCQYHQQLKRALVSRLVITNYAYWLAQNNFSSGLGPVALLICDEAHQAFGALEGFLTLFISRMELQSLGITFPTAPGNWSTWRSWAGICRPSVELRLALLEADLRGFRVGGSAPPSGLSRSFRSAKLVLAKLDRLSTVEEDWVIQKTLHGYRFVPKWVSNYADMLFSWSPGRNKRDVDPAEIKRVAAGVPKVVLMSAILSHRTCDYLGVPKDGQRSWIEAASHFPPENTPIWHVPTVRVNHRIDDMGTGLWVSRIDQIIRRRQDRKGIIFTVSYERARMLLARSEFKDIMVTHGTGDVVDVVEMFKKMPAPAVLLSPSVTTGYDFPANLYNIKYIIVGKIPYPDTTDPVTQSRQKEDKSWSSYVAMETLVQECGRATRSSTDRAEILVVDDNWKWFAWQYRDFAPAWFRARIRGSLTSVPDPLV